MAVKGVIIKDRFKRNIEAGVTVVYPRRRGSFMDLKTAQVVETLMKTDGWGGWGSSYPVIKVKYEKDDFTGPKQITTTVKNLDDVVVVPTLEG